MRFTIWLRSLEQPIIGMIQRPDPEHPGELRSVMSHHELGQFLLGPAPPTFLHVYGHVHGTPEDTRDEWWISISEIKWIGPAFAASTYGEDSEG